MKIYSIALILIPLVSGNAHFSHTQPLESHEKVKQVLGHPELKWMPLKAKFRYYDVILQNADKYKLDAVLLSRQIMKESRFKWWATSGMAHGPMGVRDKFWAHKLYQFPELRPHLTTNTHRKYLSRIGYGVEIGSQILRYYLEKNDNDYGLALVAYWCGPYSWQYKEAKEKGIYYHTNHYVSYIMTGEGL